jgi:diguanylate cyclase (GGDEF)-like protein
MRVRLWLGLTAVLLIGAGSAAAALVVHSNELASFHRMQRDEATRSARQADAMVSLSLGQLASATAFFQAEGQFSRHQFDVVARPLLGQGALSGTAFIERVQASGRAAFERRSGAPIFERSPSGPIKEARRGEYFPVSLAVSHFGIAGPIGYDLGADPLRGPYLRRARDSGRPVATPPLPLLIGGLGINVYRPVYRDGAPTATVAQRRAALIGFAVGAFRVRDLAAAAVAAVPNADQIQLRIDRGQAIGDRGTLEDPALARIHIANRVWLLVLRDPNRPGIGLPALMAVLGISLAALLGTLILVWRRDERIQELQRQAGQDPLTGLRNRRRFEEDLRAEMARARRGGVPGALLMLDLDNFKQVNDTLGHQAGDRVIEGIAGVLRARMRETDVLARLGGDEFAIVLPRCDVAEARGVGMEIAAGIRGHQPGDGAPAITASIGIAAFGADPRTSLESVVSEADAAMYAAKDAGRDRVLVFDPLAVRDDA